MLKGIYKIHCKGNGKIYIGSSVNIEHRWKVHLRKLRKGNHVNPHLQSSYNKYGEDSFSFSVLEALPDGCSSHEIRDKEQHYLDSMNWSESFNICKDSRGGEVIPEANERRRESLKKIHQENPNIIRGSNDPFYGREHTDATKELIGSKNRGKVRSEDFKKKKSELMSTRRGKHHSKEYRELLKEKYAGGNNPAAKSVTVNGVTYPTKKAAQQALGLKYGYQLDKILNAERLSREGVESSDSKQVPPANAG